MQFSQMASGGESMERNPRRDNSLMESKENRDTVSDHQQQSESSSLVSVARLTKTSPPKTSSAMESPHRDTIDSHPSHHEQTRMGPPLYGNINVNDDSDGSDGSVIFTQTSFAMTAQNPQNEIPKRLLGSQNKFIGNHDRLPSFDSVQSTGSFQVLPSSSTTVRQPAAPQFLSYEQRRKQRRQNEHPDAFRHTSSHQSYRDRSPTRYNSEPSQQYYSYAYQPQQQQHQMHNQMGSPYVSHFGNSSYSHYSNHQQQMYMQQYVTNNGGYSSYDSRARRPTPPKYRRSAMRPPQAPQNGGYYGSGTSAGMPSTAHQYRSVSPRARSGSDASRGRISSSDNSVGGAFPRPGAATIGGSGMSPKMTRPPSHVRADSSGSISSMGSIGLSSKPDAHGVGLEPPTVRETAVVRKGSQSHVETQSRTVAAAPSHQKQESSGGSSLGHSHQDSGSSFLSGLWNWSPSQTRKEMTVEEFHRRNQDFLQREGKRQQKPIGVLASPQREVRRSSKSGPPNSRGTHRPSLASIEDDFWDESHQRRHDEKRSTRTKQTHHSPSHTGRSAGEVSASSSLVSSDEIEEDDERTSLLPPSGISTGEGSGRATDRERYTEERSRHRPVAHSSRRHDQKKSTTSSSRFSSMNRSEQGDTQRWDNRTGSISHERSSRKSRRKKSKRSSRSRRPGRTSRQLIGRDVGYSDSEDSLQSTDSSDFDYRQWTKKRARMLEKERVRLIAQWKEEAKAEAEQARKEELEKRWDRRLWRYLESSLSGGVSKFVRYVQLAETFISNLPLTTAAVALAIVTLGVVWFKFAEENLDSCQPVHFHSSQCTFPEFPGCFYCDPSARMYKVAVNFHFVCSAIAGVLALSFVLKVLLATRVVLDEMSSPTTASPAGLICMTTVCVFAGRGWIGQFLVSAAAGMHLCLATWFIYIALAYNIMPEPSWFPNTVGIGLSAVKTWLYYPMTGHLLMAISLSLNFFFFPISLIRVTLNNKISAPVGWIQMSAPSISLYALTIMAQPSFVEEHPDVTKFQRVHRMIYLPCMHFLFALACIGMMSSVQSFFVRWKDFKHKAFSPAHAAFCFPTLAHANAIQAYRAAVNTFSDIPAGSPLKIVIYFYWVAILVGGTIVTLVITAKFMYRLPSWTQIDVADEEEPPAPYETTLTLQDVITTGETLNQPFVSPAILQANETGALVRLPRDAGGARYIRTRRVQALGFEPTMDWSEMFEERELLLDWVGKNAPRRRKRTLSVPGIDFNYGYGDFGHGNNGIYGGTDNRTTFAQARGPQPDHGRSYTLDRDWGYY